MKTTELFEGVDVHGVEEVDVEGVAIDSRKLEAGDIFLALRGHEDDGHRYLKDVQERGASAVLVENEQRERTKPLGIPTFQTGNTHEVLPDVLRNFYGDVNAGLTLVGVTGTNGKTTTAHLVESILEASGESTGLIGTIERRFEGETVEGDCTTPSIVETYRLLRDWSDRGATAVVMEVSSHGLDQGRVRGLTFSAAAFTNLSQDHLDYHEDMQDYYRTKKKLFAQSELNLAYSEGEYGQRLIEETGAISVGPEADYQVNDPGVDLEGIHFQLRTPDGRLVPVQSPLTGLFNYKNLSLAASVALELGVSLEDVQEGLRHCETIAGRCEQLEGPPRVVVDYAHTPMAMKNLLESLTPLVEGETICVFGAGGDRDRGKRPKMGRVGVKKSDYAILTSDNPRSEIPRLIIDDILEGVNGHVNYHVRVDRGQAIREAIERGGEGDLVLIVGRGHETEQVIDDHVIPFQDRAVAEEVLNHRN